MPGSGGRAHPKNAKEMEKAIAKTKKDIQKTGDNTIDVADQIIDTGAEVNAKLAAQTEQLEAARRDNKEIKENTKAAEGSVDRLESCCCLSVCYACFCCDYKPPPKVSEFKYDKEEEAKGRGKDEGEAEALRKKQQEIANAKEHLKEIREDKNIDADVKHDEIVDAQLDVVNAQLDVVNDLAHHQQEELEHQHDVIVGVNKDLKENQDAIRQLDARAKAVAAQY
uniref:t-SNARE coiled-coil homology domain-containing protein n=1 Tax=Lotharella oceanica TaxID=641309 RepID=A0A7S2U3K5_9EUKA|mmetsp:Transcript_856/g.1572  ORF Transcript_856/g.1572 Transcript_856/m.1572 type:complete len:224 (+) Transcript_856:38-709(+)|eukprot:CAMPEP_0170177946 /NCGR_PEP_ID=MMETSP0040_2-20121228/11449_1 /TAXON_ID=641309 /ORGANISM="Lotharella oceanica, Strain CCMP622" /LENGTH=223 /DNA_ID=CAMNT_0010420845 /DNA_START=28 /DNA_END=699 /DNA_ORIENTATION=-